MSLDPTAGHVVLGVKLDDHRFLGRMRAAQLFQVAQDPRRTEDPKQLAGNTELENLRRVRAEVQRLFDGAKRRNVEPYARYIVNVHQGRQNGMAPAIILYTERKLDFAEDGLGIQVPFDAQLVAIDGETQLAARFEAANINADTKQEFVAIIICHGRPIEWARQVFHDLNLLAVRPNTSLGLSMDARDPITKVTREVQQAVSFFRGRVNTVRRQLRASDPEVVTMTALRNACATLAVGIGGVKYGTRPISLDQNDEQIVSEVAIEWFHAVAEAIGPSIENRADALASASSVMTAIGAVGHRLVGLRDPLQRSKICKELADDLRSVRWEKREHWEGIAGKRTPKGHFSLSGAKDAAYAIYGALTDKSSLSYSQVRSSNGAPRLHDVRMEVA